MGAVWCKSLKNQRSAIPAPANLPQHVPADPQALAIERADRSPSASAAPANLRPTDPRVQALLGDFVRDLSAEQTSARFQAALGRMQAAQPELDAAEVKLRCRHQAKMLVLERIEASHLHAPDMAAALDYVRTQVLKPRDAAAIAARNAEDIDWSQGGDPKNQLAQAAWIRQRFLGAFGSEMKAPTNDAAIEFVLKSYPGMRIEEADAQRKRHVTQVILERFRTEFAGAPRKLEVLHEFEPLALRLCEAHVADTQAEPLDPLSALRLEFGRRVDDALKKPGAREAMFQIRAAHPAWSDDEVVDVFRWELNFAVMKAIRGSHVNQTDVLAKLEAEVFATIDWTDNAGAAARHVQDLRVRYEFRHRTKLGAAQRADAIDNAELARHPMREDEEDRFCARVATQVRHAVLQAMRHEAASEPEPFRSGMAAALDRLAQGMVSRTTANREDHERQPLPNPNAGGAGATQGSRTPHAAGRTQQFELKRDPRPHAPSSSAPREEPLHNAAASLPGRAAPVRQPPDAREAKLMFLNLVERMADAPTVEAASALAQQLGHEVRTDFATYERPPIDWSQPGGKGSQSAKKQWVREYFDQLLAAKLADSGAKQAHLAKVNRLMAHPVYKSEAEARACCELDAVNELLAKARSDFAGQEGKLNALGQVEADIRAPYEAQVQAAQASGVRVRLPRAV